MTRFCPNCGTEVDDSALFCPTCGQPVDQATETEIPEAPAWPEPERPTPASRPAASDADESRAPDGWAGVAATVEEPTRVENRPANAEPVPERHTPPPPAAGPGRGSSSPSVNLPITAPVTLSAWLIGGGAALAALGILIGLFDGIGNPIELLLLVALIGIAATVFFSGSIPEIPNLRLTTLVIVLIGFGFALARISFGGAGAGELLLFLGLAAAAIGAILLELGRDQPMGPSR